MTSSVSGWYPDPSGQPGERWWNGVSWSDTTRPVPAAAPSAPTDAPPAYDGFGNPAVPPAPGMAPPPYGATPPAFATGSYGGGSGQGKPVAAVSWVSRNGFSLVTAGIAVAYLLILLFAHITILGILPLFTSFRAVGRKEPLAWVAVAVGVAALIFGIYERTR